MNKIYKVVWSKAKHAYVVTSEVAKSHTKSASGKAVKAALAAAVGMGVLMGGYTANAADTTTGSGSGVAYGTGSDAPKAENVAIGKGAGISYSNGASAATGDIAVGNGANINNYASQGGSIAIGKNAKVENINFSVFSRENCVHCIDLKKFLDKNFASGSIVAPKYYSIDEEKNKKRTC